MKTDNENSEKDLNGNPESKLNTNKPLTGTDRFPESPLVEEEMEVEEGRESTANDDADIELLAADGAGSVGDRVTGNNSNDRAGVSDLDVGMRRAEKK